jgi:membrane associated rhomboid family serine protease
MPLDVAGSTYIPLLERLSVLLLAAALVLSYVVVFRFDNYDSPFATLRRRLVLGIPWGTLVIAATIYLFYHGVQGAGEPGGPNVVAFRSWSLWYPQSVIFSWLSHASESHLTGNMLGTLVFGSVVEYAWSHYPTTTGQQTFSSWRTNPFARISVFVLLTAVVGIVGSITVPGAIIGFSGVIFAYAGFAIVSRPVLAAGGILGIQVLDLVYSGLRNPIGFTEADTRFITPWWADTALQGHLFGLVVGVLLAVVLFRYRETTRKLGYIWFVALVFAVSRSMWTIFWFLSETEFILFRGLGAAAVLVLASLIAMAAISSDRSLWPGRFNIPIKTIGTSVLVIVVVLVALAGIPYNLVDVSPGGEADSGIEIDGYTVTYAENVEDQYTAIDLPIVSDLLAVNTSGVIVTSDKRNIWSLQRSADQLAFEGFSVVVVGDTRWREVVVMNHTQWKVVGGNTTYKVYGQHWQEMDEQRLLFESPPALAEPIINGSRFRITPSEEFYDVVLVRNNETVAKKPIPSHNETVQLGGVTFERDGKKLVAVHEQTELSFATFRTERQE